MMILMAKKMAFFFDPEGLTLRIRLSEESNG